MKITGFVLVMLIYMTTCASSQVTLYITPTGNDNAKGTNEQPLASLVGARDAIRNYKKVSNTNQSYTVIVKNGNYTMSEPLILGPEDSGTENHPIVYKAAKKAKPVFTGGRIITGFTVNEKGIWQIKLPSINQKKWVFDQLYVNGKRAIQARIPNEGFILLDHVTEDIMEKGNGRIPKRAQQKLFFNPDSFESFSKIKNEEVTNVRFKAFHKWDFTLRYLDALSFDSLSLTTSGKGMKPWNKLKEGTRVVLENFEGALDQSGEWFLSTDGILNYIPREGESIENTTVVAPVLDNFIHLKGEAITNEYVSNISFEGLSFEYSHYKIPTTGFEPNQAAALLNAAIFVEGARHITFSGIELSKTGQHAIWIGKGCSESLVEQCYLHNLGGGGIYLGDFKALTGVEHTKDIRINNNIIQNGGQEFPSAVGIWVGHSSNNSITHNDIGNLYYTGISIGWIWGYKPSLAINNTISFNRIHHIGWDLLSDMAGIYTLGNSPGTCITNNLVHDIHAYSYGGWGLYADEGSTGILFKDNLVYNTKTGGFQQNYGKENIVTNNIFAFAKKYQMQCTVAEEHRSFTFNNNIILFKEGMVANGAWETVNAIVDDNAYWNLSNSTYDFNGMDFEHWKKLGFDTNSFLENPRFKNPQNFDFSFKSDKSIKKIDFIPFDYSQAGVYGDKKWKLKAILPKI